MDHSFQPKGIALSAACIALLLGLSPPGLGADGDSAAAKPGAAQADASRTVRATQLIGIDIMDASGEGIGELEDLVIDTAQNRVKYAILSVGGFLGIGDHLVAYPLPSKSAVVRDGRLWIDARKERLEDMARFPRSAWPDFDRADLREGRSANPIVEKELREGGGSGDQRLSKGSDAPPPRHVRASTLLDGDLRDRKGEDIGDMEDLLLGLHDGRLTHLVVEFEPSWYKAGELVALPAESAERRGNDFIARFEKDHIRTPAEAKAARAEAEARAQAAASADRDVRLTEVIGKKVANAQGEDIAEIRDLVIDLERERVAWAVLSVGGFLGVGDRLVAYRMPAPDASLRDGRFVLDTTREALAKMEGFRSSQWPDWNRGRGERYQRASRLLTTDLADYRGRDVGDLRDVVVNLGTGRVHYAVAEFDPSWVQEGKLVAIPLERVRRDGADEGDLVMRVDLNSLNGAMIFDKGRWPDLNDARYQAGVERYLSSR